MKKRVVSLILTLSIIASTFAGFSFDISAAGETYTSGDWTYTVLNGNFCTIVSYNGTDPEVTIPFDLDTYVVQQISNGAFEGNTTLEKVTLPYTLQTMGTGVFYGCTALNTVVFDGTLTALPESTFNGCTSLEAITIPEGYTYIGAYAFAECSLLSDITLPSTITEIHQYSFSNCVSLAEIELHEGLTVIGSYAFSGCTSLAAIKLPKGLLELHGHVFNGTPITEITVPSTVTRLSNDSSYESNRYSAFYGANELRKVIFAEGMETVPVRSLKNCSQVTEIVFPSTLKNIHSIAFIGCTGLTEVTFPEGLEMLGEESFKDCISIKSLTLPGTLKTLEGYIFRGCSSLTEVTFNEGMTFVGTSMFYECTSLSEVTLPSTLDRINGSAFYGCSSLCEISLPEGMTEMYGHVFEGTSITEITVPSTITRLSSDSSYESNRSSAFLGASKLTKVVFTDGMEVMPVRALKDCSQVKEVVLPSTLKTIGLLAFKGCSGLAEINLPDGLAVINDEAFKGCSGIGSIVLPDTVNSMGTYVFADCTSLTYCKLSEGMIYVNAYQFSNCTSLEEVKLPLGLTTIYSCAFNNCSALGSIELPEGLTSIYDSAFSGTAIAEIVIPSTVTRLSCDSSYESNRTSAFNGASNLKKVIFTEGMTIVPVRSLKNCTSVTEVVIPDSVITIGDRAFMGCKGLSYVDLPKELVTIGSNAFEDCTTFADILFPETLTTISEYAFSGCTGLRLINFNEALTTIGQYAFNNCDGLISATVNGGLITLGGYAFANCDNLESVKIPETVTSIGSKLLNNTPKVTVYCYDNTVSYTHATSNGYSYYLLDENVHSHSYEVEVITEATTIRPGIVINRCTGCGYVYTEFNNSCVHQPEYRTVIGATCTSSGMAEVYCGICGHDLGLEILEMKEHIWEWVQTIAPTVLTVGEEVGTCILCSDTQTRELPVLEPTLVGVNNYFVTLENIEEIKEIRYALGTYTTGSEVKAAEKNQTLSASLVAKYTVDGVMTYEVPWMGSYTFWVRLTDGKEYFLHIDVDDIKPYLEADGVKLTVKDFKDGYKDMWIGQGEWTTYREIKNNAPWSVQISAAKLDTKFYEHDYSYTCVNPGIHTVLIRYNDGSFDVLHIELEVDEPVFYENGLQVTVSNIPDIRIIRTASGQHDSVADMKACADLRNFSNKTVIKGAESYKIQYRTEGWVTIAVEYNNGYRHFHQYYVQPKAPAFEHNGDTVTFGELDGMYILRYAPGKYTTAGSIKKATGSKYFKADAIDENGEIVITGLTAGSWSFMVQYDDESYNFYQITVE